MPLAVTTSPSSGYRVTNWARVGRQLASARELDGLVHGGGDRGLAGGASLHDPGRAALVRAPGDPDGADAAGRVPPGAAPDRRADRLDPPPLLGLDRAVPDHATLSRRAETLAVPRPRSNPGSGPVYLLVDSTGLKLGGPGAWRTGKHGTKKRRSWRKLHLGVDAATGQIEAVELTTNDVDDGSQVGPLLDQVEGRGRLVHRRRRVGPGGRGRGGARRAPSRGGASSCHRARARCRGARPSLPSAASIWS